jgi:hypothetical protein
MTLVLYTKVFIEDMADFALKNHPSAASWVYWSSISMIVTALLIFICTCFVINAPYGRYATKIGWGALVPARLAWYLMESPNLWAIIISHHWGKPCPGLKSTPNLVLLAFFFIHYVHRAVVYPLVRMKRTASPMPISVMMIAFFYCAWNGSQQALSLLFVDIQPDESFYSIHFIFGMTIAVTGMAINIHSDSILLNLRSDTSVDNKGKTSGLRYKIPRGGMFELVSCANYTGEIIQWSGFAIASNFSLAATAFAVYTFCNIGPRGYNHHKWYLEKFDDYPKSRKAVIPFLW